MSETSRRNQGERICSFTLFVRFPVTPELDNGRKDGVLPFFDDTCKVRVHQYVNVHIIKAKPSGIVYIIGSTDRLHVIGNIDTEALGLGKDDRRRSFLSGPGQVPADGNLVLSFVL